MCAISRELLTYVKGHNTWIKTQAKRASFVASKIMALDAKFCPHIYGKVPLKRQQKGQGMIKYLYIVQSLVLLNIQYKYVSKKDHIARFRKVIKKVRRELIQFINSDN